MKEQDEHALIAVIREQMAKRRQHPNLMFLHSVRGFVVGEAVRFERHADMIILLDKHGDNISRIAETAYAKMWRMSSTKKAQKVSSVIMRRTPRHRLVTHVGTDKDGRPITDIQQRMNDAFDYRNRLAHWNWHSVPMEALVLRRLNTGRRNVFDAGSLNEYCQKVDTLVQDLTAYFFNHLDGHSYIRKVFEGKKEVWIEDVLKDPKRIRQMLGLEEE